MSGCEIKEKKLFLITFLFKIARTITRDAGVGALPMSAQEHHCVQNFRMHFVLLEEDENKQCQIDRSIPQTEQESTWFSYYMYINCGSASGHLP